MCHMWADTVEELHKFAESISIKRCWFHGVRKGHPHYGLTLRKRSLAITNGATVTDYHKFIKEKKMHKYELSQGTPEGTDWTIDLEHEKLFTQEEFAKEMEDIICEAFEEELKDLNAYVFKSTMDRKILTETLRKHGFILDLSEPDARYIYEPFCRDSDPDNKLDVVLDKVEDRRKKRQEERRKTRESEKRMTF